MSTHRASLPMLDHHVSCHLLSSHLFPILSLSYQIRPRTVLTFSFLYISTTGLPFPLLARHRWFNSMALPVLGRCSIHKLSGYSNITPNLLFPIRLMLFASLPPEHIDSLKSFKSWMGCFFFVTLLFTPNLNLLFLKQTDKIIDRKIALAWNESVTQSRHPLFTCPSPLKTA